MKLPRLLFLLLLPACAGEKWQYAGTVTTADGKKAIISATVQGPPQRNLLVAVINLLGNAVGAIPSLVGIP